MNQRIARHSARGYKPISDYALIGDCHGSALVARDGSVDWCCLDRFDADPVFCRMLDANRGGFLSTEPLGSFSVDRAYSESTNILNSRFHTDAGDVLVTDFMPVGRRPGSGTHNYVDLSAPKWLVRMIEIAGRSAEIRIRYRPTIRFGAKTAKLNVGDGRITAEDGPVLHYTAGNFTLEDDVAVATTKLERGQRLLLVLSRQSAPTSYSLTHIEELKSVTTAFWREWIAYCRYEGPYRETVRRSLLTIKLLIYAPSGAIVAAPTTSLPEEVGGTRNWDYRYCWLRDAAFTLYALAISGYGGEARRFSTYLPKVCAATAPDLRAMYGIEGETDLTERTVDTFEGYRGSSPVRIGNGAHRQRQIDVYGEVLDWAHLYERLGGRLNDDSRLMLSVLADYVAEHWRAPDQGMWEMRGPPLHHVHSKIMSWVTLDRAIALLGENATWKQARNQIALEVQGRLSEHHLVQAYGRADVDAALLLAPMVAFPISSSILDGTIETIQKELRSGDFVYRYRSDDGLEGNEGAFLICSFWLVDALLQIGRCDDAKGLFERVITYANDVGLLPEEIDPGTADFLGNFPQAYTHLALIGSAAHLALFDRLGPEGLKGTYADRGERLVSATLGWRAVWAAFKATWKVGRVRSSKASILRLGKPS
jgi:GH15 family glucan-1,4-alpha-glucosidase